MLADYDQEYCNLSFDKEANITAIADIFAYDYGILSMFTLDEAIGIAIFN